jgi:hypothetical protein
METVRIRDGKKSDPGSGINIPDPQHCPPLMVLPSSSLGNYRVELAFYLPVIIVQKEVAA